jgi:hypothetical protein
MLRGPCRPSHVLGAVRIFPSLAAIFSRMSFVYTPLAVNCAPCRASMRKRRSPHLSINMTSFRSTMQARRSSLRCFFFQQALSSRNQGAVSRPWGIHLSSEGVSLKLIFNMLFSSQARRIAKATLRNVSGGIPQTGGVCPTRRIGLHIAAQFFP